MRERKTHTKCHKTNEEKCRNKGNINNTYILLWFGLVWLVLFPLLLHFFSEVLALMLVFTFPLLCITTATATTKTSSLFFLFVSYTILSFFVRAPKKKRLKSKRNERQQKMNEWKREREKES